MTDAQEPRTSTWHYWRPAAVLLALLAIALLVVAVVSNHNQPSAESQACDYVRGIDAMHIASAPFIEAYADDHAHVAFSDQIRAIGQFLDQGDTAGSIRTKATILTTYCGGE